MNSKFIAAMLLVLVGPALAWGSTVSHVFGMYPTAQGNYNTMCLKVGATKLEAIGSNDDAIAYNQWAPNCNPALSNKESWVLYDYLPAYTDSVIDSIIVHWTFYPCIFGIDTVKIGLRKGTQDTLGTAKTLTLTTWAFYQQKYATNPWTGTAWTKTYLDSLESLAQVDSVVAAVDTIRASYTEILVYSTSFDCGACAPGNGTTFYLSSTAVHPDLVPAIGNWQSAPASLFKRRYLSRTKDNSAKDSVDFAGDNTTGRRFALYRQYVSEPMPAQVFSGTISGVIRGRESSAAHDVTVAFAAKIVSNSGSIVRGTLRDTTASDLLGANPAEFRTTSPPAANQLRDISENTSVTMSSVTGQEGDHLVVELGICEPDNSATRFATLVFDAPTSGDLPQDDATTTDNAPWVNVLLSGGQSIAFFSCDTLRVNAAGFYTNWSVQGTCAAGTNYQQVDETTPDDATTYLYADGTSGGPTHLCSSALSGVKTSHNTVDFDSVTGNKSIKYVEGIARMRGNSGTADTGQVIIRTNADLAGSKFGIQTTAYFYALNSFAQAPGSVAWIDARIDSCQIGLLPTLKATGEIFDTWEALLVYYTTSGGGAVMPLRRRRTIIGKRYGANDEKITLPVIPAVLMCGIDSDEER